MSDRARCDLAVLAACRSAGRGLQLLERHPRARELAAAWSSEGPAPTLAELLREELDAGALSSGPLEPWLERRRRARLEGCREAFAGLPRWTHRWSSLRGEELAEAWTVLGSAAAACASRSLDAEELLAWTAPLGRAGADRVLRARPLAAALRLGDQELCLREALAAIAQERQGLAVLRVLGRRLLALLHRGLDPRGRHAFAVAQPALAEALEREPAVPGLRAAAVLALDALEAPRG